MNQPTEQELAARVAEAQGKAEAEAEAKAEAEKPIEHALTPAEQDSLMFERIELGKREYAMKALSNHFAKTRGIPGAYAVSQDMTRLIQVLQPKQEGKK